MKPVGTEKGEFDNPDYSILIAVFGILDFKDSGAWFLKHEILLEQTHKNSKLTIVILIDDI